MKTATGAKVIGELPGIEQLGYNATRRGGPRFCAWTYLFAVLLSVFAPWW